MDPSFIFFRFVGLHLLASLIFLGSAGTVLSIELRNNANVVVELFTSQSCLPCPRADRLLYELSVEDNVIALAYHVNYWDYTGWKDTFALSTHSELQSAYAGAPNMAPVYTPQIIINGVQVVVASKAIEVKNAIADASLLLRVRLDLGGPDVAVFKAEPRGGLREAVVWLITFRDWAEVDITSGPNIGDRLAYSNIVTSRRPVGMWDSRTGAEIRIPISETLEEGSDGFALIIQERSGSLPGRILGGATLLR